MLIDQQFRVSLNREVSVLYEENDLLWYAVVRELELYPIAVDQEVLGNLLGKIRITTSQGSVTFRVSDESGTAVATNGILPMTATTLTSQLAEGQRGWELKNTIEGKAYIHAASPLSLDIGTYYLENCRDVTELFANRQFQYQGFFAVLLILAAVVGILSMAVTSAMLCRPVGAVVRAAEKAVGGGGALTCRGAALCCSPAFFFGTICPKEKEEWRFTPFLAIHRPADKSLYRPEYNPISCTTHPECWLKRIHSLSDAGS